MNYVILWLSDDLRSLTLMTFGTLINV
jgi:hypothetical protein